VTAFAFYSSGIEEAHRIFATAAGGIKPDDNLDVVIYYPSRVVRGHNTEVDPEEVHNAIDITAFGLFLVGQQAAKHMLARGKGSSILFTGELIPPRSDRGAESTNIEISGDSFPVPTSRYWEIPTVTPWYVMSKRRH
jgi:NAD(P)-dependent dehydrogenase (short-subunit alcohol dehydrogenase family)